MLFRHEDLCFFGEIVPFSLFLLDCTKPEMRNILAVPGPTLGSRRPCIASSDHRICSLQFAAALMLTGLVFVL